MTNSDTGVVVIGGGAAGIAAARRLTDAGVPCLLVEARERLGGRAWTVDHAGFALDLGCGWLHSADRNPWGPIAETLGYHLDKSPPPWRRGPLTPGFPQPDQQDFMAKQAAFYDRLEEAAKKGEDAPAQSLLEPNGRWNGLLNAIGTYISGAELDRVSLIDLENYADSNVNWRVIEGYGTAIAAHGRGLSLALNCPVRRIDHGGKRLRLETDQGAIEADQAIVALPSAIIAEQDDLFVPALPEKTDAARGLPLGLADKLFLSLERPEEFEKDTRLFGRTDRAATANYHMRPFGRPLIEVYVAGRNADELERDGVKAFFDFALSELTHLLGRDFARRVKPLHMHPWRADPFARGSYSYAEPGKVACRGVLAAPLENRLFFAGEACSKHDYSTAHGAYFTGIAAADAVIAARKA